MRLGSIFLASITVLLLTLPLTSEAFPNVEWQETYASPIGFVSELYSIAVTSKHIYATGYMYHVDSRQRDLLLLVANFDGSLVEKRRVGVVNTRGRSIKVEEVNGDEYAYVIGYRITSPHVYSFFLVAFKNAEKIWVKEWKKIGKYEYGSDLAIYGDRIYVVGSRYYSSEKIHKAVLACLRKSDGELLWEREWADYDVFFYNAKIMIYKDAIYLVGGIFKNDELDIIVLKYSLDGILLSSYEYSAGNNIYLIPHGAAIHGSYVYVSGEIWESKIGRSRAMLYCFELGSSLKKIWEKTYGEDVYYSYNWFGDLKIYRDHIYVVGGISKLLQYAKGIIAKYDLSGNRKWLKTYNESVLRTSGLQIHDDKIYICGSKGTSYYNPPDYDAMLMQVVEYFSLKVTTPGADYWVDVEGDKKSGPSAEYLLPMGMHEVQVEDEIEDNGVKHYFKQWSDGVTDNPRTVELYEDTELEAQYGTQYYVTVDTAYSTASGEGWYDEGETATISVAETQVDQGNDTRRIFQSWKLDGTVVSTDQSYSFTVNEPQAYTAEWKTQYYVRVYTDYSTASGEGWYDKGSVATISVAETLIQGIPFNKVFKGWRDQTGAIVASQQTYSFTVDTAKILTAVWEDELNLMAVAGIGAAVAVVAAAILLMRRKKPAAPAYPPPPPPPP